MTPTSYARLIRFLKEELAISQASIAVAERVGTFGERPQIAPDTSSLPMILWQYGLVSLEQLDKIFDWLETAI